MTSELLQSLPSGKKANLGRVHPTGTLSARREATGGVKLSWRYTKDGKDAYEPIGYWDAKANPNSITGGPTGFSIKAAMRAAEAFALAHHNMLDDGGFAKVKEIETEAKRQIEIEATTYSLHSLCDDYAKHLKAEKKSSARDVESALNKHVVLAHPLIANKPARQVTSEDVATILRRMVNADLGPHSVKVRSYLFTAFKLAQQAPFGSSIPERFKHYNVEVNPVERVPKETKFVRSAKDPLSLPALRVYWQALEKATTLEASMLRFHLLLGGPRIEQLTQLLKSNCRADEIILKDGKGRGGPTARDHVLPLTKRLRKELHFFAKLDDNFALCVTPGKAVSATHLSRTAQKLVGQNIPDFLLKRVRSGVETLLSAVDVPKEIRGRLQSHGIGGVQDINYNAWEFMPQKLAALQKLESLLTGELELPKT